MLVCAVILDCPPLPPEETLHIPSLPTVSPLVLGPSTCSIFPSAVYSPG